MRPHLRFFYPIIQFSPPRTGSTLVWNVLRELFPGRTIKKHHTLKSTRLGPLCPPVVCTIRHPMDAMASCIQCRGFELTDQAIVKRIDEVDRTAQQTVLAIQNNPRVLILKYERFSVDYDFLFDELEKFFKTSVTPDMRSMIREKYDVEKVKQKTEQMGDFSNWNKDDRLHGRHISKFKGASGYFREFFSADQIRLMEPHYRKYMNAFGYEV